MAIIMKKLIISKSRLLISIAFVLAVLSIPNSCTKPMEDMPGNGNNTGGNGGSGGPGTNEVWIKDMAYNPATITIAAGTTIKWINKDAIVHTATGNSFNSGNIGTNGTYSHTFATTGTFEYYCIPHPTMTATVTVN